MIIGLLIFGALLVDTGLKGTQHELGNRLANDLLGTDGFIVWIAAFAIIGGIGYIPTLEKPSRYLIALLLVVIFLRNGGVVGQFQQALTTAVQKGPAKSVQTPATSIDGSQGSSGGGSSGGGAGNAIGGAAKAIGTIATIAAFL